MLLGGLSHRVSHPRGACTLHANPASLCEPRDQSAQVSVFCFSLNCHSLPGAFAPVPHFLLSIKALIQCHLLRKAVPAQPSHSVTLAPS